jgi:hypothetical protein
MIILSDVLEISFDFFLTTTSFDTSDTTKAASYTLIVIWSLDMLDIWFDCCPIANDESVHMTMKW